ncbi:T9SS type A sorting domain-containing protein [Roseivirga pacifica]|nr:T9SS type A sorting domain-containing protein [Roseivirga pacifica]MCO6366208.1 T9SS type A sorting domain-containing protein [Roseivirga pacifica]MCO6369241.1 T9SS type A sorting domain-containing protein [Roseivirga pacifica]MCO6374059.1 T9SS type A sorting domain-containing protein [Roseivirga pacifica]MCO6378435.1 T9SS type A sorting domain-containing protein [Roseivirga pacifica]
MQRIFDLPCYFMRSFLLLTLISLLPQALIGQFQFKQTHEIPLSFNGTALSRAWEGGLNSPQFQTMDLNGDGTEDLVIYHRMAREITTYLNLDGEYVWSNDYAQYFPEDVVNLLILKDYDCDGKKDIFTTTALGIKVYRNTSTAEAISWEVAADFLSFDTGTNIQLAATDIPGITDVNGDGVLDLLVFRFGTTSTVDYYQNTGSCGSLSFTRAERRWGDFQECDCSSFVFGETCPPTNAPNDVMAPNAVEHAGGKLILPFDADNDGDIDIITADETCETLYFLENVGTPENALMTSVQSYPLDNPAGFPFFPSAFMEDINQDGLPDLLIASNADNNIGNLINFSSHVKVYENTGTVDIPAFQTSSPFLQHEMLDLGENTYPTFTDIDADGDLDLFIGTRGQLNTGDFKGQLYFFENTGNTLASSFELQNEDYLALLNLNATGLKPQFIDFDGNGTEDLLVQATFGIGDTRMFLYSRNEDGTFASQQTLNVNLDRAENPHFYDVNNDGKPDLLVGNQFGSLSLFLNEGNNTFGAEINGFGGIEDDFDRLNLSVAVADFDADGTDDLLTIDNSGQMRLYEGPINMNFEASNPHTSLLIIGDNTRASAFGTQNFLSTADVSNSGKPNIFIGTLKGGIYHLENESNAQGGGEDIQLLTRPNPTSTDLEIISSATGLLTIYDTNGKTIKTGITVTAGEQMTVNIQGLPAGIYILRLVSDTGKTISKKVIVTK